MLFIYEYIGILILAYAAQKTIGGYMLVYAVPGIYYFYAKARSMKYVLSGADVYFSPSIGENEEMTVMLTDILAIQVVDRHPWKFFRLGTLILITDPDEDMQPCMKCLIDPHKLAQSIRARAQVLGAHCFPIETI
jgi:hypothetical protein